jgi:hypothetical protein
MEQKIAHGQKRIVSRDINGHRVVVEEVHMLTRRHGRWTVDRTVIAGDLDNIVAAIL